MNIFYFPMLISCENAESEQLVRINCWRIIVAAAAAASENKWSGAAAAQVGSARRTTTVSLVCSRSSLSAPQSLSLFSFSWELRRSSHRRSCPRARVSRTPKFEWYVRVAGRRVLESYKVAPPRTAEPTTCSLVSFRHKFEDFKTRARRECWNLSLARRLRRFLAYLPRMRCGCRSIFWLIDRTEFNIFFDEAHYWRI